MIVVTVFLSILNQMEFHLVQNIKETAIQFERKSKYSFGSVRRVYTEMCRHVTARAPLKATARGRAWRQIACTREVRVDATYYVRIETWRVILCVGRDAIVFHETWQVMVILCLGVMQ